MEQVSQLPKSTPEAQGIPSGAIMDFVTEAERTIDALHSLMLLRHGQVVAEGWWEPYEPADPHVLFSLSKSFTSTAVGLAAAEGKLRLDAPVISFFPEEKPVKVSDNLAAMQVRHLLSMSTGHAEDTTDALYRNPNATWVQTFLSLPVKYLPGTHFLYNTGATYMLSAIVQKVTGQTLIDYLQPRLFEPLGITNAVWESSPQGINTGGFGLSLTTAEVARFGQLYLQKGVWEGKRLLPQGWVEEATSRQISNGNPALESDWTQGYGYQFWRSRSGAYRGDGAFGQYCVVMPEQDAVLVITSGVNDMQAVLNLVWKHLLPAMETETLEANPTAQQELARKLENLALPTVQGKATSSTAAQISGKKFFFDENKLHFNSISLDFDSSGGCILTLEDKHGSYQLECGNGSWRKGTTTLDQNKSRAVGASGGWTSEDTYVIRLYYRSPALPEPAPRGVALTPFGLTITCRFAKNKVIVDQEAHQSMISTKRPRLEGRMS